MPHHFLYSLLDGESLKVSLLILSFTLQTSIYYLPHSDSERIFLLSQSQQSKAFAGTGEQSLGDITGLRYFCIKKIQMLLLLMLFAINLDTVLYGLSETVILGEEMLSKYFKQVLRPETFRNLWFMRVNVKYDKCDLKLIYHCMLTILESK